jgi:hypothetical protein
MGDIRITLRCIRNGTHIKVLQLHGEAGMDLAEAIARIEDGSSPYYIHKPGALSPIGKCALCGGQLESEVKVIEDAEPKR